jgi:hypothetical protein
MMAGCIDHFSTGFDVQVLVLQLNNWQPWAPLPAKIPTRCEKQRVFTKGWESFSTLVRYCRKRLSSGMVYCTGSSS